MSQPASFCAGTCGVAGAVRQWKRRRRRRRRRRQWRWRRRSRRSQCHCRCASSPAGGAEKASPERRSASFSIGGPMSCETRAAPREQPRPRRDGAATEQSARARRCRS
eukprot:6185838-Pleurochrysis_carterae.AAC.4